MTPIEIMALIIAVFAIIKMLVILINPKSWMSVVKTIYAKPVITGVVGLVLALITLYYLLEELTIVQIFAVILLVYFLMLMGVAGYSKELLKWVEGMLKDKRVLKKAWLALIIWILLIVWVLSEIFA